MRIFFFSDRSDKGQRVHVEAPCDSCRTKGAILMSNGSQGAVARFDSEQEMQDVVVALMRELEIRKGGECGAQVRIQSRQG